MVTKIPEGGGGNFPILGDKNEDGSISIHSYSQDTELHIGSKSGTNINSDSSNSVSIIGESQDEESDRVSLYIENHHDPDNPIEAEFYCSDEGWIGLKDTVNDAAFIHIHPVDGGRMDIANEYTGRLQLFCDRYPLAVRRYTDQWNTGGYFGVYEYFEGSSTYPSSSEDETTVFYVGRDSDGGYIRAFPCYNYTSSNSANTCITSLGTFHRSTASSANYKHDVNYLTNIEYASEEGLAKQPEAKLTTLDTAMPENPDEIHVRDANDADEDMKSILDLPVVQFHYNEDYVKLDQDNEWETGFIAEDIAKIIPECAEYKCALENEGTPDEREVFTDEVEDWNMKKLVPRMLYVIQEQEKRITELENKLA